MKHSRLVAAITVAASLCLFAAAQDCPRERASAVAAKTEYGPPQNCPGAGFQIAGVQLQFPANACPLHLIYTPAHDVAVQSQSRTMVRLVGQDKVTMVAFRCERTYFLFLIPWDSACVAHNTFVLGTVKHLITVPCPPTES